MTVTMFTIDTLEFSRDLEKAGMQRKVAETLAEKIKESQVGSLQSLATKSDLIEVKQELKSDIALLRQEIKISMLTAVVSLGTIVALVEKFVK